MFTEYREAHINPRLSKSKNRIKKNLYKCNILAFPAVFKIEKKSSFLYGREAIMCYFLEMDHKGNNCNTS